MRQGSQVSSGWEKETKKFTSSSRWLNHVSRSRLASCLHLRSSEAKTWQTISRWWSRWLSMDARPNTSCIKIAGSHRLIFPTFSDSKTCQNCNKKALRNFLRSKVELAAAVSHISGRLTSAMRASRTPSSTQSCLSDRSSLAHCLKKQIMAVTPRLSRKMVIPSKSLYPFNWTRTYLTTCTRTSWARSKMKELMTISELSEEVTSIRWEISSSKTLSWQLKLTIKWEQHFIWPVREETKTWSSSCLSKAITKCFSKQKTCKDKQLLKWPHFSSVQRLLSFWSNRRSDYDV